MVEKEELDKVDFWNLWFRCPHCGKPVQIEGKAHIGALSEEAYTH